MPVFMDGIGAPPMESCWTHILEAVPESCPKPLTVKALAGMEKPSSGPVPFSLELCHRSLGKESELSQCRASAPPDAMGCTSESQPLQWTA